MTHSAIFINLPVRDLDRSKAFFQTLGYHFNDHFTDDTAACLVISECIHAMLLTEPKFQSFTPKPLADATQSTEVLLALPCPSREEVDALVEKAVAAGGSTYREPVDYGFMYQHGYQDLDGHIWEIFWMDPTAAIPAESNPN